MTRVRNNEGPILSPLHAAAALKLKRTFILGTVPLLGVTQRVAFGDSRASQHEEISSPWSLCVIVLVAGWGCTHYIKK